MVPEDGIFRYVLKLQGVPEDSRRLLWLPFWRFRGLRYRVGPVDSIGTSLLDTTVSASDIIPDTLSLGIVPQAAGVRLTVDSASLPPPVIDSRQAIITADVRLRSQEKDSALFYRIVGETRSLIYAPFRIIENRGEADTTVLRAVWGNRERFSVKTEKTAEVPAAEGKSVDSHERSEIGTRCRGKSGIKFLPLICPECGSSLPEKKFSIALRCPRCSMLWAIRQKQFTRLDYGTISIPVDMRQSGTEIAFLPFWSLRLELEGFPLNSRAAIRRMLVSWQKTPEGLEKEAVLIFMPAFKLNPGLFLRVAARMSVDILDTPDRNRPIPVEHDSHPVCLPLEEAAQAVKVVLAHMFRRHRKILPFVPDIKPKVRNIRLLFLPFENQGRDLVQCHSGFSITKRALELGSNV